MTVLQSFAVITGLADGDIDLASDLLQQCLQTFPKVSLCFTTIVLHVYCHFDPFIWFLWKYRVGFALILNIWVGALGIIYNADNIQRFFTFKWCCEWAIRRVSIIYLFKKKKGISDSGYFPVSAILFLSRPESIIWHCHTADRLWCCHQTECCVW